MYDKQQLQNENEQWWFTKLRKEIKKVKFGKIKLELSIKNGKVSIIKTKEEKSHSFNNKN